TMILSKGLSGCVFTFTARVSHRSSLSTSCSRTTRICNFSGSSARLLMSRQSCRTFSLVRPFTVRPFTMRPCAFFIFHPIGRCSRLAVDGSLDPSHLPYPRRNPFGNSKRRFTLSRKLRFLPHCRRLGVRLSGTDQGLDSASTARVTKDTGNGDGYHKALHSCCCPGSTFCCRRHFRYGG